MAISSTEFNERHGHYPGRRQASTGGKKPSFAVSFDTSLIDATLDQLNAATKKAVRPAAQLGAEELYLEARIRCPVSAEAHYFYGTQSKKTGVRYLFQPGNLRESLYQVYSKDKSGEVKATYHVAWNHKEAPYGFMVEYGTSRAPAHPFLRPAYDAKRTEALQIAKATYVDLMKQAIPGLQ